MRDKPTLFALAATIFFIAGFLPAGRATILSESEYVSDSSSFVSGGCPFLLQDIAITPAGRVLACCSAGALTKALKIGNLKSKSLLNIIESAKNLPLIKFLTNEGPEGLINQVECIDSMNFNDYVSTCHFCYEILSKLK